MKNENILTNPPAPMRERSKKTIPMNPNNRFITSAYAHPTGTVYALKILDTLTITLHAYTIDAMGDVIRDDLTLSDILALAWPYINKKELPQPVIKTAKHLINQICDTN